MMDLLLLIGIALISALISLVGGIYLLYSKKRSARMQVIAVPVAAGALLAAVFFDLLPEALHEAEPGGVLALVLIGFLLFFILERSLSWFHHHHSEGKHTEKVRNAPLIIAGDSLHNLIDGMTIGAAFLVSPATGVVAAVAVATHEIPQEIGDFGLLLRRGMRRSRVLMVNLFSSLLTVLGAVAVFYIGGESESLHSALLALAAGFFIYIAASDIIPTIHNEPSRRVANIQTAVLLASVVIVVGLIQLAHGFIPH